MPAGKRVFDGGASAVGLLLLSPLFALISLVILTVDGAPVLFRQERIGQHGTPFRILKFRTMVRDAEQMGRLLTIGQDTRVTRLGRWLRKYKLDELPQLFNVLCGQMSLVGPRPEVPKYVALYTQAQRQILELMPGITDPASIAFRDEAELLTDCVDPEMTYVERVMPEKIRLNLAYAAGAGRVADMEVICRTLFAVFIKR